MSWIGSLLVLVLRLAGHLTSMLEARQLISAGEAKAQRDVYQGVIDSVQRVKSARDKLSDPAEQQRVRDKGTRPD